MRHRPSRNARPLVVARPARRDGPVDRAPRHPGADLGRAAALGLALFVGAATGAGPARVEAWPIQTTDTTTDAMLRGDARAITAAPVRTIAGELRLPTTTLQKVPAVVFLHGDAGELANQPPWIDALVGLGIAVFTVDSFTGRGLVSTSNRIASIDGEPPGAAPRVVDAYRALAILAHHPRIDASRVALMGVSSGARTTILAAMKRFSGLAATDATRFRAYVALYAPCNVRLVGDDRLEDGPVRIYSGASDDVTRAAACERYVGRLRAAGVDATMTSYAGAFHGFDNPPGTTLFHADGVASLSACDFEEREGSLVNVDTGRPPAPGDACRTTGFTAGRDAAADTAVRGAVADFLTTVLAPGR